MVPPVVGALVGAVIVGGVWYGTYATGNHQDIVAKVGDKPITRDALIKQTEAMSGDQMLSQLITNQLVLDAAKKKNITTTTKEVDKQLKSLEQQDGITSDAQLQQALKQSHMTKQDLMDQLKIGVLEKKIAESKVTVTEKQIEDYYNKNKKSLATPKKVAISDIVVSTKAKASDIKTKLSQGSSFADLAKQDSTDTTTKSSGGKLGTFSESDLNAQYPDIAKTAFKLKKGEVSDPIKVNNGYELITVTAITPSQIPTLDKAKSQIKSTLTQQNLESPQQLIADLMKSDNVQILDSSYSDVKTQLANPAPATGMPTQ